MVPAPLIPLLLVLLLFSRAATRGRRGKHHLGTTLSGTDGRVVNLNDDRVSLTLLFSAGHPQCQGAPQRRGPVIAQSTQGWKRSLPLKGRLLLSWHMSAGA